MGTWYTSFKGLGIKKSAISNEDLPKKVIVKSQRQFMYGSNFYVSDVR